jgi:hypothetical protein
VRQSGLGLAQHGRISKRGRSHARAMLVEAAWAAAKAPGPLRAFFLRIRARRGHLIAAVAVARKLAVLCWQRLTKSADYQWARPALVANKLRAMELQAGQPARKGNKRGTAYAYNVKALRDAETELARHAEEAYERFVSQWQRRGRATQRTGAAKWGATLTAARQGLHPPALLFATRSPVQQDDTTARATNCVSRWQCAVKRLSLNRGSPPSATADCRCIPAALLATVASTDRSGCTSPPESTTSSH